MGAIIEAVATTRPTRQPLSHGARRLADTASRRCLQQAGRQPHEVDLLVNAGVYRERALSEPALAALIQQDIDANLGHPPAGGHGTFSFDIDNGAAGVLTGVHLARGFLASGAVRLAMVVASDSARGPSHLTEMPYAESGGALLLRWDDATPGFVAQEFATFPEYEHLVEGYYEWVPRPRMRPGSPGGRNRMMVVERPGYRTQAASCAAQVGEGFLAAQGVSAGEVDLLLATGADRLGDEVADRLGIAHTAVAHLPEDAAGMHTAEPMAMLQAAMRTGAWAQARTALFLSAGSGITVAAALHRS